MEGGETLVAELSSRMDRSWGAALGWLFAAIDIESVGVVTTGAEAVATAVGAGSDVAGAGTRAVSSILSAG